MHAYPHHYRVTATGAATGDVALESGALPGLVTAPPAEFGGPGDRWSPETLLVGAVADCFVLTFRAVARQAGVRWTGLRCEVDGTLDRSERRVSFTEFSVRAQLEVPPGVDEAAALAALERAEQSCLIVSSLRGHAQLSASVRTVPAAP